MLPYYDDPAFVFNFHDGTTHVIPTNAFLTEHPNKMSTLEAVIHKTRYGKLIYDFLTTTKTNQATLWREIEQLQNHDGKASDKASDYQGYQIHTLQLTVLQSKVKLQPNPVVST